MQCSIACQAQKRGGSLLLLGHTLSEGSRDGCKHQAHPHHLPGLQTSASPARVMRIRERAPRWPPHVSECLKLLIYFRALAMLRIQTDTATAPGSGTLASTSASA